MGKIIHSISGGKTSAYLATHYPADHVVFSLVCVDNGMIPFEDKKLRQRVNDRLEKHNTLQIHGKFIGTPEDPGIIKTVFDLEQHIGKEIVWLRGIGYDKLIDYKGALPNGFWRFCTSEMKLAPIFKWTFLNIDLGIVQIALSKRKHKVNYWCIDPVKMGIGYRWDEAERKDRLDNDYEMAMRCLLTKTGSEKKSIFYKWRVPYTPMIDDEIGYFHVQDWANKVPITFVPDSNCLNCFYKPEQQLLHNLTKHPSIKEWAHFEEEKIGSTFKNGISIENITQLEPDPTFVLNGGSGCSSGMCTD